MLTNLMQRSYIDIYLNIIQEDGGNVHGILLHSLAFCVFCTNCFFITGALHACINATTLALINAGIPMVDYLCAVSVGFADGHVIVGNTN